MQVGLLQQNISFPTSFTAPFPPPPVWQSNFTPKNYQHLMPHPKPAFSPATNILLLSTPSFAKYENTRTTSSKALSTAFIPSSKTPIRFERHSRHAPFQMSQRSSEMPSTPSSPKSGGDLFRAKMIPTISVDIFQQPSAKSSKHNSRPTPN